MCISKSKHLNVSKRVTCKRDIRVNLPVRDTIHEIYPIEELLSGHTLFLIKSLKKTVEGL